MMVSDGMCCFETSSPDVQGIKKPGLYIKFIYLIGS